MGPWQTQVFHSTLKTLCTTTPQAFKETISQGVLPSTVANDLLLLAVPMSVMSAFESISPRAARTAFSEMEDCTKAISRADLVDTKGEMLPWPHILSKIASVFIEQVSGQVLVQVGQPESVSSGTRHSVLIRDLRFRAGLDHLITVDDDDGDLAELDCNCKAFEFRGAGELLCKHAIVAMVAAGANLAPRRFVSEEEFIDMVGKDP